VVRAAATVPLGLEAFAPEVGDRPARVVAVLSAVAAALAALASGSRRRDPFAAALALASLAGLVLGIASATRAAGPLHPYLLWWCAALPVPAWIALGLARPASGAPGRAGRWPGVAVGLGATAAALWVVAETARMPLAPLRGSRAAPAVTALLLREAPGIRTEGVLLVGTVPGYPDYAAVYATLHRQGIDAVVPPEWVWPFGREHVAGARAAAPRYTAYLLGTGDAWRPEPPGLAAATPLGSVAGVRVWLARPSP
jgi:hypothetical protein